MDLFNGLNGYIIPNMISDTLGYSIKGLKTFTYNDNNVRKAVVLIQYTGYVPFLYLKLDADSVVTIETNVLRDWYDSPNTYFASIQNLLDYSNVSRVKRIGLPSPPSSDGTYNLQCVLSNRLPSYSWRGVVKGETVRGLNGVQTYTITLPVNSSSSVNVYRVLKGCLIVEDTATACFEITYGQTPNNNISVPTVNFISSGLTMTYNQTDGTITFSSTTKRFYACIYSVQELESFLGLPLTFA